MFFVSDIYSAAPSECKTVLQEKTYHALQDLRIPFKRVDTDEAITMDDCVQIDRKRDMKMVKTLFLCNRQQTAFYLFVTAGDKPFKAKEFSHGLGVARVSFAPADVMEKMLGTKTGAATVFSAILDKDNAVQIVFDKEIIREEWYGCSDGTTTGYVKIKTAQILHDFLPSTGHIPIIIEV